MGLNLASQSKVMAIWIWLEHPCSISSIAIFYGPQLDIPSKVRVIRIFLELPYSISIISIYYEPHSIFPVKSYAHLNLPRASLFHFEHFDIRWVLIGNPSQNLQLFEFAQAFLSWFLAFRCTIGPNQAS